MSTTESPVLTAINAAAYLSVSKPTLYRLIKKGEVKPVKLGGRTLFRRADLDALIERSLVA